MTENGFENSDEELFPACTAANIGEIITSEYGVQYICDHIADEGLGYCWVQFSPPTPPEDRES